LPPSAEFRHSRSGCGSSPRRFVDLITRFYAGERFLAAAGLAAVAAMLAAGMFEYNFGDSEFLMLFLVLITLPFAATHRPASAAA